jgi:antitoxin component HigA of HigAB toxin-antitoxin module
MSRDAVLFDHIAFGVDRLRHELAQLQAVERDAYLGRIPQRIDALNLMFQGMGLDVQALFEAVGTDYDMLCESLQERKSELLQQVARPLAA